MSKGKANEVTHETHLGVDAWVETPKANEAKDAFASAAQILAGDEPDESGN